MDGFTHLHVHSQYSLLDGACRFGDLVKSAKAFGMDAVAVTDHGNMFGAMHFYKAAKAAGIKPILGLEAYISPTTRFDRSMGQIGTAAYHMVLLAMDTTGWRNLVKLSSRAYLEGFYYKPRIDRDLLAEFGEGLICTTACLGGEVPQALLSGNADKARRIAGEYLDIFGSERFFIEIQKQGLAEQDRVNPLLVDLARELGVGIVGTNDVHFLRRDDRAAHEVLTCIATAKRLTDEGRLTYPEEVYFKSPQEMRHALAQWPQAADNTLKIAEMCNLELDYSAAHLPVFNTPDGSQPSDHLSTLAWDGLAHRFGERQIPEEYRQRLQRELDVIRDKGYCSYFLIVNDFVQYAKANCIPAAPRGSGVATLLGYCLGIADVDPMKYGLLFERFTDPQREEAPDIDIDLCQEGRPKVIQYVREKYGHVAQIITYGTLKAKAVIRDVARVLDVPLAQVDTLTKLVPDELKMTLDKALAAVPELRRLHDEDEQVRRIFDFGRRLEGLTRHVGVHAAGVIVAQEPLEGLVPLCKQTDSTDAITQWDGPTCDKIGLMKMDFLGLRTLTIIQRARELVREHTGRDIDPETLPLDDDNVFELFQQAHTDGVFQFESGGMKNVLRQMQPSKIEELIAANAMFRPGPMELIPSWSARKRGTEAIPAVHDLVDDLLAETYGIMAYQEQVMQVLNRLGRLPLNRALTLIKAISKKKHKTIEAERTNFMAGTLANGIAEDEANRLFELILKFAGYGFNKAHSTRYAIIAYQTAYFKVYYPKEFLAATLTYEAVDTKKVVQYMEEAKRMEIPIAPPDINACGSDFSVDGDRVRFGLAAVKGVGAKAVDSIVYARGEVGQFKDLYHFCNHVDLRQVNRTTIEALIKCGAFDSLGAHRGAMVAALGRAVELGNVAAQDRKSGQMNFFNLLQSPDGQEDPPPQFPDVPPWSESQLLAAEKETLGFFITSHPMVKHARVIDALTVPHGFALARANDYSHDTRLAVGCMIAATRYTVTRKKQERMAVLVIEDLTGKCEAVVFPDAYKRLAPLPPEESIVFITGSVDRRRDEAGIVVDEIIPVQRAIEEFTAAVHLLLPGPGPHDDLLQAIKGVLANHHGHCPVYVQLRPSTHADVLATVQLSQDWSVKPSPALLADLIDILDEENVRLTPKPAKPRPKRDGPWKKRPAPNRLIPASQTASPAVTRFN